MIWWDNLVKERIRNLDAPVATWIQMKVLMRARFVPQHYTRELRQRPETLKQGSMSAEEAYYAMQVAMARANVIEDHETTNARYLRILHPSLSADVDMFPYSTPTQLLHLAIKVERKSKARYQGNLNSSNIANKWRSTAPSRDYPGAKEQRGPYTGVQNAEPGAQKCSAVPGAAPYVLKLASSPSIGPKGSTSNPTSRARDVECFKCNGRGHMMRDCPNKRTLLLNHLGQYES